jgi:hypothetical protein
VASFRRGTSGDIEAAKAFLAAGRQLTPVATSALATDDRVFWLAIERDEIISIVLTRPVHYADAEVRGGIEELLVASNHRGNGNWAATAGACGSALSIGGRGWHAPDRRRRNRIALHLYEQLAYEPVQHRVRMVLDFASAPRGHLGMG